MIAYDNETSRARPRAELRAAVKAYLEALRDDGREPNRRVLFGDAVFNAWLISDPFHHAVTQRWLLLEDGDTFCETRYPADADGIESSSTYGWLESRDDHLEITMRSSVDDIADGGDGYLCGPFGEQPVFFVTDRRRRPRR